MMRTNSRQKQGGRYYSRYIAFHAKRNYPILALGAMFLAGVLIGTLLLRSASGETMEYLMRLVNGFVQSRREQTLLENFTSGISSSIIFIAVLFFCGFCAISQPITVTLPFFKGLGIGFSVGTIYANNGPSSIGYVSLLMLPGILLTTIAVLICCRESLRLSGSFFAAMNQAASKEFYSLRIYTARYLACGILCVFSAFLEAVLHYVFANSFVIG